MTSSGAGIVETVGGAGDFVVGIDGGVGPPGNIGAVPWFDGHRVKLIVKEPPACPTRWSSWVNG
ncbi:MAG: hypothetical protein R2714_05065 [Microthrixaceae bacterium]